MAGLKFTRLQQSNKLNIGFFICILPFLFILSWNGVCLCTVHWTNEFFICWNCQMRGRFSLNLALEIKPNSQIQLNVLVSNASKSVYCPCTLHGFSIDLEHQLPNLCVGCEKSTDVQWYNVAIPKRKRSSAIMLWRLFYLRWEIGQTFVMDQTCRVVRVVLSI